MRRCIMTFCSILAKGFTVGFVILHISVVCLMVSFHCQAETVYRNEETGYEVRIEDDAQLLSSLEKGAIQSVMEQITAYGNAALKTIDKNNMTTAFFIEWYYREQFGQSSGTVFLIDMDNRNIWIYSDGTVYDVITKSYADTITDNVYTYASAGDYYQCCYSVFDQEVSLLNGYKIAQPMKYVSNAFLALIMALMINYFVVRAFSATRKPDDSKLMQGSFSSQHLTDLQAEYVTSLKRYSPRNSGRGGRSGGGRSRGGRSGGGGGHRF